MAKQIVWEKANGHLTNLPDFTGGAWKSSPLYYFAVYEIRRNAPPKQVAKTLGFRPQEINQDDIFAIEVTPTFRGVLVEAQGAPLKDISISGTTGIHAFRGHGLDPSTGQPNGNAISELNLGGMVNSALGGGFLGGLAGGLVGGALGSPAPEDQKVGGYEIFHRIRALFRVYAEGKRVASTGKEFRMVWHNDKDNEHLWVEPVKFTMKRSSTRPMMYDYNIMVKGVGIFKPEPEAPEGSKNGFFADVISKVNKIVGYIKKGIAIYKTVLSTIQKFQRDVVSLLLSPLEALNEALGVIAGTSSQLQTTYRGLTNRVLHDFGITRDYVEKLLGTSISVEENFNDYLGKDMTDYNKYTGRTPTTPETGSGSVSGGSGSGSTPDNGGGSAIGSETISRTPLPKDIAGLNGADNIRRALVELLGVGDSIFKRDNYDIADEFTHLIENPEVIGIPEKTGSREAVVQVGDNIQIFALRETGDLDEFRGIVRINKLKPPYKITPGQILSVPDEGGEDKNYKDSTNKKWNINKGLNSTETSLGVDLKLSSTNDFIVAANGDLDMIASIENLSQALLLKLQYDKYSLKRHPDIGAGLDVGRKTKDVQDISNKVRATLEGDSRVETVSQLKLTIEGGTVFIDAVVVVAGSNKRVPIIGTI